MFEQSAKPQTISQTQGTKKMDDKQFNQMLEQLRENNRHLINIEYILATIQSLLKHNTNIKPDDWKNILDDLNSQRLARGE